jgi:uncharacterized Zn finger protein
MNIDTIFTRGAIQHLSGPRFFERGASYAAFDRVKKLKVGHDEVTATVRGQHPYQVRLWIEDGEPAYSCTCPVGMDGLFCKHCVAVGLAFARRNEEPAEPDIAGGDSATVDLTAFLHTQAKEKLVDLILEQARNDEFLRGRLLLEAAKKRGARIDLDGFRNAIESVINVGEFVDYRLMYAYSSGIQEVVDSVETLLKEGHATEVVELTEHALTCLEDALGRVDDSDDYMGGIKDRVCELHHEACAAARPEPESLAQRLFEWELYSERDTFYGAAETYADVLGDVGLAVYRRLSEEVWAKVPPITSRGERDRKHLRFRFNITHMMEALARVTGDLNALVAVKANDLSYAYHYVQIVELYRDAGRFDDALEWAEKGLAAFPERTDFRLLEVLADEYHRHGRHDDVLDLMWSAFTESPGPVSYERLCKHVKRTGRWDECRPKALDYLRSDIAQRKRNGHPGNQWSRTADHSDLVDVFMWEEDVEAAWAEAKGGGCSDTLWMRLAALREADHPGDAVPLYQGEVERTIGRKNNRAYEEAVELLHKVKDLMGRAGRGSEFPAYLRSVRATHKPKRNLMKLLDRAKW